MVGSGISATITHYKTAPDLVLQYHTEFSASYPKYNEVLVEWAQYHSVQHNGSIIYATKYYRTRSDTVLVQYDPGPPALYYDETTASRTETLAFSGFSKTVQVDWVYKTQSGTNTMLSGTIDGIALDTGECGAIQAVTTVVQWILANPSSVEMQVALADAQGYCLSAPYPAIFTAVGKQGQTGEFAAGYELYGQGCAVSYDSVRGEFASGSDADRICYV